MDRYLTPPEASIYNFKNIVNTFVNEARYQSYVNKLRNIDFSEKRNGNIFAWNSSNIDLLNPVISGPGFIQYYMAASSYFSQDLDIDSDSYYTLLVEVDTIQPTSDIKAIIHSTQDDFYHDFSIKNEINVSLTNGTNVIRFKTSNTPLDPNIYLRFLNDSAQDTNITIQNLILTEGLAAILNARYNEFEKLIRYNGTEDYWEISIDNMVTWERIWTESAAFDDKLNEMIDLKTIGFVHQDNILAGNGIIITPSFIEDPVDPLIQYPALTIDSTGGGSGSGDGDWTREDVVYQSLLEHSDFSHISYNTLAVQGTIVLNGTATYSGQGDDWGVGRIYGNQGDSFETDNLLESGASDASSFYVHCVSDSNNLSLEYSIGSSGAWGTWIPAPIKTNVITPSSFSGLRIKITFNDSGITNILSYGVLYGHELLSGQAPLGFLETFTGNVTTGTNVFIPNGEWYHKDGKSLEVFYDGIRMLEGVDYTETDVGFAEKSNAVQFTFDLESTKTVVFKEIYGNPESVITAISMPWIEALDGHTAQPFQKLMVDTTSAPATINLYANPSIGDEVQIIDKHGTFNINNLNINGDSSKIMNQTNPWPIGDNFAHATLVYVDSSVGWRVYHYYSFMS